MKRQIHWDHVPGVDDDPVNQTDDISDAEIEEMLIEAANDIEGFLVGGQGLEITRRVRTPFGEYDADDPYSPFNMFECWIGHTSFRIEENDFNILNEEVPGIGCLKVLSPYRFFIGIERQFTMHYVRQQIDIRLCEAKSSFDDSTIHEELNSLSSLLKGSKNWAIYMGQDGKIDYVSEKDCASPEEFETKFKELNSLKNGSILICKPV